MTTTRGSSAWKWFYLVTKVFVFLWTASLLVGLVKHSPLAVPLVNLGVWGALCVWANRRVKTA